MGTRPASNICSRFSEEYLDAWRLRFDEWIRDVWLPLQPQALRALLRKRAARLGTTHARPYWADVENGDT
eukprot:1496530-Pleurochrysis_carterae.AAC.1